MKIVIECDCGNKLVEEVPTRKYMQLIDITYSGINLVMKARKLRMGSWKKCELNVKNVKFGLHLD